MDDGALTITFRYRIGQRVRIVEIDPIGRVSALLAAEDGQTYKVIYWNDGTRHEVWMQSWELRPIPREDASGAPPNGG